MSKRVSAPDLGGLNSMAGSGLAEIFKAQFQAGGAEEWILALDVDRPGFEEYANSLIKEYNERLKPLFDIGIMVRHKNGFGVLNYDTKGLILDRDYDIQNHTYYYLVEYYASYVSPMTDGKAVAVKMNTWIPEATLIKEPFTTDVEKASRLIE